MGVVHKYGGSSVATIEKIRAIAQRVAAIRRSGQEVAVVASAMGKTTNALIEMARQTGGADARELDALLSTGEQQTVTLIALTLNGLGVPAVSLSGAQCGFLTNSNHARAKIRDIDARNLTAQIAAGKVPVIAGFQGVDEAGDVTTLGRGGSDTTAVAIAAKLGWDCDIYTDVDCIYRVDPRKCPGAKPVHRITCEEMMEMASLGAGVLETRSVELAKKYGVRLYLGKTLETQRGGTYIMEMDTTFEGMPVSGISIKENCVIESLIGRTPDFVSRLFALIAALDINVDMISQQLLSDGAIQLCFSCSREEAELLHARIAQDGLPYAISTRTGLTMLSLVGVGMITHSGIASRAFSVLHEQGIRYYQITTSEISISLTVDADNAARAVRVLADAFALRED